VKIKQKKSTKKTLIVSAACIAVCADLPNPSAADALLASESGASVETTLNAGSKSWRLKSAVRRLNLLSNPEPQKFRT
jgi:hypothetical protein